MSKSRVCTETPINQKPSCSKKTNLLVYEREKGEGCTAPKTYVPPISMPQVKRIKVCTGAQLKKMCPPPPCPCPPKIPSPTLLNRLARLIGLGAKSLLALGVVYITYDMGIWGDNATTGQVYKTICSNIMPSISKPKKEKILSPSCQAQRDLFHMYERDPYCCDKFPIDNESSVFEAQQKWNRIVSGTFSSIAEFPSRVKYWSKKVYCKMFETEKCKQFIAEEVGECCPCDDTL